MLRLVPETPHCRSPNACEVGMIAMDRSRPSLLLSKQQSDTMGLGSRLRLVQADVHQLPFSNSSVDRITCRFGIMFFAEIDTAFTEMLHVLKPAGRVALLAWGRFEQPFFESTVGVVLPIIPGARMPEPASAMFKFSNCGSIEDALSRNRFRNIEERHITLPRIWVGSSLDFWQHFQKTSTLFQPLMRAIPGSRYLYRPVFMRPRGLSSAPQSS